jgi:hypothetical protein
MDRPVRLVTREDSRSASELRTIRSRRAELAPLLELLPYTTWVEIDEEQPSKLGSTRAVERGVRVSRRRAELAPLLSPRADANA